CGNTVKTYIQEIPIKYTKIELDQYIIMPNHIHVIINIVGAIHESPLQIRRRNMLLSKMVGYIKMRSAKQINVLRNNQ
ncbi:MAG: transposase, partial [Candidatus Omnitrophica bacterium]|nr:transposase [Candidatus Omnitrophota bacterium]